MLTRILVAVSSGLVVAVILIEAISAGLNVLLPSSFLYVQADDGFGGPVVWPLLLIPALIWLVGSLAGGTMAAAAAPQAAWGLAVGLLLALPAILLVGLVTPGNPMALLAGMLPLAGAAAGTALTMRLRQAPATTVKQTV